jgi:signal transduction histidine kinase
MIPTDSMHAYREELKTTWRRTLYVILGVATVSTVLSTSFLGWSAVPKQIVYNFIVSISVGSLFWLSGPYIRFHCARLARTSRWIFRVLAWAILMNAGLLLGLGILGAGGVLPWELFGIIFWRGFFPNTLIGVTCATGFTMYETLKYKAQLETTQARLSSLESRLHPHFLFNTLNSIIALIPEDPIAAERVTVQLSALLRYSLDSTHQSTVRLEQEVKIVSDYLEIEKTRFGSRLQYSVDVPPSLMQTKVPPFCLQTLVENSVKYGGNEIRVTARNGDNRVVLNVWDSGSGFKEEKVVPGHGLHDLRGRLAVLWGTAATLDFPDNANGTAVRISIPSRSRE